MAALRSSLVLLLLAPAACDEADERSASGHAGLEAPSAASRSVSREPSRSAAAPSNGPGHPSASRSPTSPGNLPPVPASLSRAEFVQAFVTYTRAYRRAPGQGGSKGRPDCGRKTARPACEHGRLQDGVPMRIRWGPGRPDTLRIFTGSAHPKRLGLACTDIAPGATRTAKGSAPAAGDTTQIHCSWPQEDGATMTVVIEESARGTTLAAFHPPHLEWDADYARTLGIIDAP